jgi:hypothetical protein
MRLTWKDGLATVLIALAVVFFAVWSADGTIAGLTGRGLVMAIFVLGVAGCYTAQAHFETVYGVNGNSRPPMAYVVVVSVIGALATVAGVVAMIAVGSLAVTTLLLAMIVLWILATTRHQLASSTRQPTAVGR